MATSPAHGTSIAIVEDDADAREVLADLLREEGYSVKAFGDGAEAFDALRASAPPDLILLDLRLPGMDGWAFRVEQKRHPLLSQTPVIALSADRSSQAQAIDADEFLEKPPRLDKLLTTINAVLSRAAEKRRRANQIALEGMAALGQLAAGVAHEINNPLAYVCGNLHVLREELARLRTELCPPNAEPIRSTFDELDSMLGESLVGAERIRDIVRDMRLLAKVDDSVSEPVDLNLALDSAIGIAKNLDLARARIVRAYDDPPDVMANEGRIVHLFFNLLANALQALPEKSKDGEVVLETATGSEGEAIVRVRDNGVGIPREIYGRIFEPFFTTRAVGAGRGLGLSVSQGIATALGGKIEVESEVGRGTTFVVTLPAARPSVSGRASQSPPTDERPHVLVIDDEPAIGRVLARVLRDHFDVTVASGGRDGLERALTAKFDVILSDLLMADVSGIDLFNELARSRPGYERKIVFMSGAPPGNAGLRNGGVDGPRVLEKPLDAPLLISALYTAAHAARR